MDKLIVRLSVILVGIYFVVAYLVGIIWDINIFYADYVILLELCLCLFVSAQGKYHCKYIKYLAYSICASDTITRVDNYLDFLSAEVHNLIPITLIAIGFVVTIYKAFAHFYRATKLKYQRRLEHGGK